MIAPTPLFGIVGYSGSGKTTLLEKLLPELAQRGRVVHVIKHSHHDIELEPPQKDSARLRAAGAAEVLIASPWRYAIMHELHGAPEPDLATLASRLAPADLILVEGCKTARIPKLEVWRAATGKPLLNPHDTDILAIAGDPHPEHRVPLLALDNIASIADFLENHLAHART